MVAADEALARIARSPIVHLLGRRSDGWPTAWPMTAQVRDGAVEFSTYRTSAKVRLLLAAGRAALVTLPEDGDEPALVASGPIALAEGASWPPAQPRSGRVPIEVPAEVGDSVAEAHRTGKRVMLRLTIEHAHLSPRPPA